MRYLRGAVALGRTWYEALNADEEVLMRSLVGWMRFVCLVSVFGLASPGCDSEPSESVTSPDSATSHDAQSADAFAGDAPGDGPAPTAKKRVFVTSAQYQGNVNGMGIPPSGYDVASQKCSELATVAGLGGSWAAWLYTSEGGTTVVSPSTKVGAGPWYLVDARTLVFADKSALASPPLHAIDLDETGTAVADHSVWTGAPRRAGDVSTCESWTSTTDGRMGGVGHADSTTNWEKTGGAVMCSQRYHFYCFEL